MIGRKIHWQFLRIFIFYFLFWQQHHIAQATDSHAATDMGTHTDTYKLKWNKVSNVNREVELIWNWMDPLASDVKNKFWSSNFWLNQLMPSPSFNMMYDEFFQFATDYSYLLVFYGSYRIRFFMLSHLSTLCWPIRSAFQRHSSTYICMYNVHEWMDQSESKSGWGREN